MQISSDQALDALDQVHDAQSRISVLRGYGFAAPHFLLWGCIWVVGFLSMYLFPTEVNRIWTSLDVLGIAGSILIVRYRRAPARDAHAGRRMMWRFPALLLTCAAFMMATYLVFQPQDQAQFAVFPALLAAAIYIGLGLWRGLRWIIAGLILAALVLGGYFLLHQYFALWMAMAGGGTLLMTGFWLRRT